MVTGTGVCDGIGVGRALVVSRPAPEIPTHRAGDPARELAALEDAFAAVITRTEALSREAGERLGEEAARIFEAHLALLRDEKGLLAPVRKRVSADGANAAHAVWLEMDDIAGQLRAADDAYLRARAADIEDLRDRVVLRLLGLKPPDFSRLPEDAVLIAADLAPSDAARLDTGKLAAIVTAQGGSTGHTAIMARLAGLPAVVGCAGILGLARDGDVVAVDGGTGDVCVNPDNATLRHFRDRQDALLRERELLARYRDLPAVTADGTALTLLANIGGPRDIEQARHHGAEGVGLVRSEFLYMERPAPPGEEEQYNAYRAILEGMAGRPVTVRTLDAGGDKNVPSLGLPPEANPYLGCRAIRLCLREPALFKTQLRALLRAGAHGPLRVMFPMISSVEELAQAKDLLEEARRELEERAIPCAAALPVGVMVELPAAALLARELAAAADFFSIGTNDLIQYTVAADRGNSRVAELYSPYHPAVLRLVAGVISAAREAGIGCGMCGEAAAEPALVPLFVGMGLRELSVSPTYLPGLRRRLRALRVADCAALAREILPLGSESEIREALRQGAQTSIGGQSS